MKNSSSSYSGSFFSRLNPFSKKEPESVLVSDYMRPVSSLDSLDEALVSQGGAIYFEENYDVGHLQSLSPVASCVPQEDKPSGVLSLVTDAITKAAYSTRRLMPGAREPKSQSDEYISLYGSPEDQAKIRALNDRITVLIEKHAARAKDESLTELQRACSTNKLRMLGLYQGVLSHWNELEDLDKEIAKQNQECVGEMRLAHYATNDGYWEVLGRGVGVALSLFYHREPSPSETAKLLSEVQTLRNNQKVLQFI